MVLFGLSTASGRVLPRWNALPLVIGLLPTVIVFPQAYTVAPAPNYFLFAMFALLGLGYVLLGYVVRSGVSLQATTAAG
jgi:hypothetical protein